MKILMIAENDPAGTAIQFTKAINQLTKNSCRLITWQTRYNCNFEKDIHLEDNVDYEEIEYLLKESDIIHFHMLANEEIYLGPFQIKDFCKGKEIIRHHHGHYKFRENLEFYQKLYKQKADKIYVSTPDMIDLFEKGRVIWIPNLILFNEDKYKPKITKENTNLIKIAQSPTRKQIKSTDILIEIIKEINKDNIKFELDLIEMESHLEVLRRKGLSNLVFDQMNYSFGVSSLESFSLGVPVICKLEKMQIERILQFCNCDVTDLPWILVNDKDELRKFLKNCTIEELNQKGLNARKFMENYWQPIKVLKLMNYD